VDNELEDALEMKPFDRYPLFSGSKNASASPRHHPTGPAQDTH
jgi:hypothetical protein